jgi:hypothetical protein
MLGTMRLFPLILLVFAALTFAACGGSEASDAPAASEPAAGDAGDDSGDSEDDAGSGDASDDDDSGGAAPIADDLYVSNGVQVLGASAEAFTAEINSMEGHMEMVMSGNGMDVTMDGEFAFQSPAGAYISMEMSGDDGMGGDLSDFGTLEMLIRDGNFYMNFALFGGWVYFPVDEMGLTGEDFEEFADLSSLDAAFDYDALVEAFGDVEYVGEENVGGRALLHYAVDVSLDDAVGALGAIDSGGSFSDLPTDAQLGPLAMDIWVGADDLLPYQLTMDMSGEVAGQGAFTMDLSMYIDGYNTDVTIPPAPADAVSMEELFSDSFIDVDEAADDPLDTDWDDVFGTS